MYMYSIIIIIIIIIIIVVVVAVVAVVAINQNNWGSYVLNTWTSSIYFFITLEAEEEGGDPIKLALAPHPLH